MTLGFRVLEPELWWAWIRQVSFSCLLGTAVSQEEWMNLLLPSHQLLLSGRVRNLLGPQGWESLPVLITHSHPHSYTVHMALLFTPSLGANAHISQRFLCAVGRERERQLKGRGVRQDQEMDGGHSLCTRAWTWREREHSSPGTHFHITFQQWVLAEYIVSLSSSSFARSLLQIKYRYWVLLTGHRGPQTWKTVWAHVAVVDVGRVSKLESQKESPPYTPFSCPGSFSQLLVPF